MKEDYTQMALRHHKEIEALQSTCRHTKTTRMPFEWAPGHRSGDVDVCNFCGKVVLTPLTGQDCTKGEK